MPCDNTDSVLDDFLDGSLEGAAATELRRHTARCDRCRGKVEDAEVLRATLKALPVDGPSAGFFADAMARARDANEDAGPEQGRIAADRRRFFPRIVAPSAIAAAVMIWFAASFMLDAPGTTGTTPLPEVALAIDETRPVNLVFTSPEALSGARVSLAIPQGIELAGFGDRRELSWTTDLKPGKNVLQLPITALAAVDGELVARLEHGAADKTFRVKIRVI